MTNRKYIFYTSTSGRITYIPENHYWLIRARFARGESILSLLFPLSRKQIAEIVTSDPNKVLV